MDLALALKTALHAVLLLLNSISLLLSGSLYNKLGARWPLFVVSETCSLLLAPRLRCLLLDVF